MDVTMSGRYLVISAGDKKAKSSLRSHFEREHGYGVTLARAILFGNSTKKYSIAFDSVLC